MAATRPGQVREIFLPVSALFLFSPPVFNLLLSMCPCWWKDMMADGALSIVSQEVCQTTENEQGLHFGSEAFTVNCGAPTFLQTHWNVMFALLIAVLVQTTG